MQDETDSKPDPELKAETSDPTDQKDAASKHDI